MGVLLFLGVSGQWASMAKKRIGVLTSGGDCPGLNPGIVGVSQSLFDRGYEVVGIVNGFKGLMQGEASATMDLSKIERSRWMHEGGTMLGSRRVSLREESNLKAAVKGIDNLQLDGLVVFGGDGSLKNCAELANQNIAVVGIPKTIDRDVPGTEQTIGYASAVELGCEMVERLRTTAASHGLVFLVEVMGRRGGHLALGVGVSSGADGLLVAEARPSYKKFLKQLNTLESAGRGGVVVMAEGCWFTDLEIPPHLQDGKGRMQLGWAALHLESLLKKEGLGVRATRLGHTLRGGRPVASDRLLAYTMGKKAAASIGESGMVCVRRGEIILSDFTPLEKGKRYLTSAEVYEAAEFMWG